MFKIKIRLLFNPLVNQEKEKILSCLDLKTLNGFHVLEAIWRKWSEHIRCVGCVVLCCILMQMTDGCVRLNIRTFIYAHISLILAII